MPPRADWFRTKVAVSSDSLAAGDGYHHDEVQALSDYLYGRLIQHAAAEKITAPVLAEQNPSAELYHLWTLLSEALVELDDDREMMFELLSAIQALPSTAYLGWSELEGFGHMWSDLYRLHLQGKDPWEDQNISNEGRAELCRHFATVGTAEAGMYLQGLRGVTTGWGYEVLNLVCSRRPGLEIMMNQVHAWLSVAGAQLRESVKAEDVRSYSRPVVGGKYGLHKSMSGNMVEHWTTWKNAMSELSGTRSSFSDESKRLTAGCYALM